MKTKLMRILTFTLLPLYFYTGCFLSTGQNLEKLPDRKFYFTEFQFILPGQNKDSAHKFFKNFPVKKIMYMLAKEYNLTIDISDFGNFVKAKKLSVIETEGSFRISKHTWKKNNAGGNRIIFIFEQDYMDDSKMKFSTGIYTGNSSLKIINTEISKIDEISNQLTYYLKSGDESLKEYDAKNYGKISPIPMIVESGVEIPVYEEPANITKIKSMIDEYVKTLDDEKKKEFKHDIIDFIYQKCN